ncbi:Initiation factor 2B-related domain-containing protein [Rozella allomycis CSF55]|uniref:Translation initiation factor eIF2B subunit delta n=1 Tax=Rozella allomycis (strain CSF55) TaxID=988480 RepID=A0A075AMR8_ROZAC|nr:Initiation factor 2B-related domain-containing protein [Rozella allomycis CSF55]|eukprot:EPZ30989.1 Initiation factor 2B-related domain-containing protein [Rozella allomycis CSF55]
MSEEKSTPRKTTVGFNLSRSLETSGFAEPQKAQPIVIQRQRSNTTNSIEIASSVDQSMTPRMSKAERKAMRKKSKDKGISVNTTNELPSSAISPVLNAQRLQVPQSILYDDQKKRSKTQKNQQVHRTPTQKLVTLFSHLPQYEKENSFTLNIKQKDAIHPIVIQLGLLFAEMRIVGANSRCIAMLNAFKQVIEDYHTPPNELFSRHLDLYLKPMINYLVQIRPLAVSMANAIRFLKKAIADVPVDIPEVDAKEMVCSSIDNFIRDRIVLADELIVDYGITKIHDNDSIIIYAKSSVVLRTLIKAHQQGKKFHVFVVDSRPLFEGKKSLQVLNESGIDCTYLLLESVGSIISQASKIFMGSHCLFSNGAVMSRVGSSLIAMMGYEYNLPVIAFCETYKFSERVQLDSIVFNEVGDPDSLIDIGKGDQAILADWRDIASLKLLNIMYDVSPSRYISLVISEVGQIPCTSVPVVIREYGANYQ